MKVDILLILIKTKKSYFENHQINLFVFATWRAAVMLLISRPHCAIKKERERRKKKGHKAAFYSLHF